MTMSLISATETRRFDDGGAPRWPLAKTGVLAGAAAAIATTGGAVAARAFDVPLAVGGTAIPLAGFAQLTFICSLLGVGLAKLIAHRSGRARRHFVLATTFLVGLSFIPDITITATNATKVVLMLIHLLAAAIVIPALARRLSSTTTARS